MAAYVRKHLTALRRQPAEAPRWRRRTPTTAPPAISDTIDAYLAALPLMTSRRGRAYAPKSIASMADHLRPFARWCGERTVDELDAATIGRHYSELRGAGRTDWTIAGRDKALRSWLGWCVERGILRRSPLELERRRTAADPPVTRYTPAEVDRLLAACDRRTWAGTRDVAIVLVLYRCGVRASELVGLDLADFDSARLQLRVRHGKGDKPRTVGVPDDAAAAVLDWIAVARGRGPGPLFPSERGDARLTRNGLALMLRRLGTRAGVEHVHAHRFRHTFACEFLRNGGDSLDLQRVMGHATLAMTARYTRALADEDAAARHVQVMRKPRR